MQRHIGHNIVRDARKVSQESSCLGACETTTNSICRGSQSLFQNCKISMKGASETWDWVGEAAMV
jgi:hypothetical protein